MVGAMLSKRYQPAAAWWFVPLLLLADSPGVGDAGAVGVTRPPEASTDRLVRHPRHRLDLLSNLRGQPDGLATAETRTLAGLTLTTVAASVVVDGLSVTPPTEVYRRRQEQKKGAEGVELS